MLSIVERLIVDKLTGSAASRLVRLLKVEGDLDSQLIALEARDAAARGNAAGAVLSRMLGLPSDNVPRVNHESEGQETLKQAITAAIEVRKKLLPEVWKEQAGKLREQAAKLEAQANALDTQCEPHLAALRKLQGCRYIPFMSDWHPLMAHGMNGGSLPDDQFDRTEPKSAILRAEANALRLQASRIEAQTVRDHGVAEAVSIDELISIAGRDPYRIAPPAFEIRRWAGAALERARPVENPYRFARHPEVEYHFRLEWATGKILAEKSACTARVLAPAA